MIKMQRALATAAVALVTTACAPGPTSSIGFRLPDGDPATGGNVFIDMQCHACHTIPGVELPAVDTATPVSVSLGGPASNVKTYGNLVTSIINPSHRLVRGYPSDEVSSDGESFMPVMNEIMTVQQLVDLVAYLQDQYEVIPPLSSPYGTYNYD
jgi:mono/diheme cytochrome c family protein